MVGIEKWLKDLIGFVFFGELVAKTFARLDYLIDGEDCVGEGENV